jgi:protein TonB
MMFSCAAHAVVLGGFLWAVSAARPSVSGYDRQTPLVIEMLPLGQMHEAPAPRAVAATVDDMAVPSATDHRLAVKGLQQAAQAALAAAPSASRSDTTVPRPVAYSASASAAASTLDDYQRRLNELIARHSRYPAEARRQRLAGVTQLAFRIDRRGALLDSWIQESSGSELLDSAALAALERATPLPPVPPALATPMDFVVEIDSSTTMGLGSR